ncbi:bifunctional ADP-dependent NAD(P)H-hydrate dehydratase/NAD(P)H-hydrate epimerase [Bifidobacterium choloepi]|nr:bifunctional ADP-dependent NAD(P)H-hydrate dehydratase/NAD(P)H-hydrate epimerase [Bifidobacterium choloepi]
MQTLLYAAWDTAAVRSMEQPLLAQGVPLMTMAAQAAARTVLGVLADKGIDGDDLRVTVLAGAGDNGGDGLYAGAYLAARGYEVTAIATGRTLHASALDRFVQSGGRVWNLDPSSDIPGCPTGFTAGEAGRRLEAAVNYARESHVVLDAMTGIGVTGALRGIPAALASSLGLDGEPPEDIAVPDAQRTTELPIVVAIDTPSGVGVDDGSLPGAYIPADYTVMFGAMKPCAMLPPAAYALGHVTLVDFGFDLDSADPAVEMVNAPFAAEAIRPCQKEDSKYRRGVVGLVTGSDQYPGAAVLTSLAAAHSNIGMVRYMGPSRPQDLVLHALPEAVIGKGRVEAWGVGSGVPSTFDEHQERDEEDADAVQRDLQTSTISALLAHYALSRAEDVLDDEEHDSSRSPERYVTGRFVDGDDLADAERRDEAAFAMPPIVVDAGALDLLPANVPSQVVLTPHAGELARLLTRLGHAMDADDVTARPLYCAKLAARLTGATVLLKGAITIVAGSFGGAMRVLVSGRAPACLATAGAGDVLTGIVAALLAQQDDQIYEDPACVPEIAAAGAYLHGRAAAIASGSDQRGWVRPRLYGAEDDYPLPVTSTGHPIVAGDVIDAIPFVFDELG